MSGTRKRDCTRIRTRLCCAHRARFTSSMLSYGAREHRVFEGSLVQLKRNCPALGGGSHYSRSVGALTNAFAASCSESKIRSCGRSIVHMASLSLALAKAYEGIAGYIYVHKRGAFRGRLAIRATALSPAKVQFFSITGSQYSADPVRPIAAPGSVRPPSRGPAA